MKTSDASFYTHPEQLYLEQVEIFPRCCSSSDMPASC